MQVILMACVPLTMGERNEAVKTAIKMESATKTLVDNLIAELAQLRRENAEMTMKAELLANEVRRLSPRAPEDQGEIQVHKHGESVASLEEGKEEAKVETLAKTSLETSDESTNKVEDGKDLVKGCPVYTQLTGVSRLSAYIYANGGNGPLGCIGMQYFAEGSQQLTCPYNEMDVDSGVHDGKVKFWKCCGITNAREETVWSKQGATQAPGGQQNCLQPQGSLQGHIYSPCATTWQSSMNRQTDCIQR